MRNGLDLIAARVIGRSLRQDPVDLGQFACSRSHKIGGLLRLLPGARPPFVVTRRMDYPIKRSAYRRWLYGRAVDGVVVISRGVEQEVLSLGVDPEHVHVIHDGVDTADLARWSEPGIRAEARSSMGMGETDLVGVTLASLHERKGQDILLEALAKVEIPGGHRLHWFFAGQGPLLDSLRERARALREARGGDLVIHIPGEQVEAGPLLAAADVFCLPSRREGLGVALLEAMAVGLPVVASRVGGMVEAFVDEVSGLHVGVEDVDALAVALGRVLADHKLSRRLATAARERVVEEFDIRRMCEKTEALYRRLASEARGS